MATTLAGAYLATTSDESGKLGDAPMVLVNHAGNHASGPMRFALTGKSVAGLYPGAIKQMQLTVVNPYGFRIQLQRLTGRVATASRHGCAPTVANLEVHDYNGRLPIIIAAHERIVLAGSIPIAMPRRAAARCAGSHFTIVLSGLGSRVGR